MSRTVVAVGIPHAPIAVDILAMVKKALQLQATQSGNPKELREMLRIAAEHQIVPEIDLYTLDDVPKLMASLAKGEFSQKVGIHIQ